MPHLLLLPTTSPPRLTKGLQQLISRQQDSGQRATAGSSCRHPAVLQVVLAVCKSPLLEQLTIDCMQLRIDCMHPMDSLADGLGAHQAARTDPHGSSQQFQQTVSGTDTQLHNLMLAAAPRLEWLSQLY